MKALKHSIAFALFLLTVLVIIPVVMIAGVIISLISDSERFKG